MSYAFQIVAAHKLRQLRKPTTWTKPKKGENLPLAKNQLTKRMLTGLPFSAPPSVLCEPCSSPSPSEEADLMPQLRE